MASLLGSTKSSQHFGGSTNQLESWCSELQLAEPVAWGSRLAAGSLGHVWSGREASSLHCAGGQASLHSCTLTLADADKQ